MQRRILLASLGAMCMGGCLRLQNSEEPTNGGNKTSVPSPNSTDRSESAQLKKIEADFSIIDGEVATNDSSLSITGETQAPVDVITAILVHKSGNVFIEAFAVEQGSKSFTFDIYWGNVAGSFNDPIPKGNVTICLYTPHSDGIVGDGELPDGSKIRAGNLVQYLKKEPESGELDRKVVLDRLRRQTVNDDGSDDGLITRSFEHTEGYVELVEDDLILTEDDLLIDCITNRQPGITEVLITLERPNGTEIDSTVTQDWPEDGRTIVAFDVSSIEDGSYVIKATTGSSDDECQIEIQDGSVSVINS